MKKSVCFMVVAMLGASALAALLTEQRAFAADCKACTGTADCTADCVQEEQPAEGNGSSTYLCYKIVADGDAGKKCADADPGNSCENNTQVNCGVKKAKACAKNSTDCSNPTGITQMKNSGCV